MKLISNSPSALLFATLVVCAVGGGNEALGSCGDYLYKRGDKSNDMPSAMEEHEESGECNGHKPAPAPIAPLPPNPLPQNDHFVQTVQSTSGADATRRQNQSNRNCEARRGHRSRIDRPPQR